MAVNVVNMKTAVLWLRHHLVWYIDINISEEHALTALVYSDAGGSRFLCNTSTYPPNHMDHISSLRMSHLTNLFYFFIYIQIDPKRLENLLDIEQV
jgi:hypothetical protein